MFSVNNDIQRLYDVTCFRDEAGNFFLSGLTHETCFHVLLGTGAKVNFVRKGLVALPLQETMPSDSWVHSTTGELSRICDVAVVGIIIGSYTLRHREHVAEIT